VEEAEVIVVAETDEVLVTVHTGGQQWLCPVSALYVICYVVVFCA
jgi:hypothetical protein